MADTGDVGCCISRKNIYLNQTLIHMRIIYLLLSVVFMSSCTNAQPSSDSIGIDTIIIFNSVNFNDVLTYKNIEIDAQGHVKINGKISHDKFDIASLHQSFKKFIASENLKIIPANNNPPPITGNPKANEQLISLRIIPSNATNEDSFAHKSQFRWKKMQTASDKEFEFYKFLNKQNLKVLQKLLK